jgi:hypothetical protein
MGEAWMDGGMLRRHRGGMRYADLGIDIIETMFMKQNVNGNISQLSS